MQVRMTKVKDGWRVVVLVPARRTRNPPYQLQGLEGEAFTDGVTQAIYDIKALETPTTPAVDG